MQNRVRIEAGRMKLDYDRPLIAYAYLAESGAQNDILSGLIPIIAPVAKAKAGKYFDQDFLCQELRRLYGIEVHPWALDELVPRLVSAGVLLQNSITRGNSLYRYAESFAENHAETSEDDIQEILDEFIVYANEVVLKSGINLPEELLRKHFFNQIVTSDFQVRLIRSKQPVVKDTKILQLKSLVATAEEDEEDEVSNEDQSAQQQLDQIKIICASYILHTSVNQPEIFKRLLNIATGAILAEYILNLREPNSAISLKTLKIYLDGPLAMSFLDLSEEKAALHISMLIDMLQKKGGILCIFKEHVDEIRDNLRAALSQDGSGIRRPTHRRMQSSSFRSYAQSVLSDLEGALRRKNITVISPPRAETYFSDELQESLIQALGNYSFHARARDAHAIGGVMRLRGAKITSRSYFHECQHIFITENKRVASVAFNFAISDAGYKESYIPPVITDRYLAGLMFVLYGGKSASELTHQKLLANCASALEPNHTLLSKVTSFLSDVSTERAGSFVEMMTSARSSQHRAIYLLNETNVIHDMADAERAFVDFEAEITESLNSGFIVEREETRNKHASELEELATEKAARELEIQQSRENYESRISELESTLRSAAESNVKIAQALDAKNLADKARELDEIKDVVYKTIQKAETDKKVFSGVIAGVGFLAAAYVNYLSFDLAGPYQKVICALGLVVTPLLSSYVSNSFMRKSNVSRRKRIFDQLIRGRVGLARVVYDYDIDLSSGSVELRCSEPDIEISELIND